VYRKIEDFLGTWKYEGDATLRILDALSDASLAQRVTPDGRSLGQMAWHLAITLGEMMGKTGLTIDAPPEDAPPPSKAREIRDAYAAGRAAVAQQVMEKWTDAMLDDELQLYGQTWKRRDVLMSLVVHQAHHRGQMTVLMRQAGLVVPGIYGPAREEWGQYNMPAPW
jgi:uncharacterized damage-inducible protein DinB